MSISSPQNRDEFRQYILTKLGAPVIEINVAEEQIDIAIDDAFQYFNERSHFYGTENMYLTTRITSEFVESFSSFYLQRINQNGKNPNAPIPGRSTTSAEGMVNELTLITPGENYQPNNITQTNVPTVEQSDISITTTDGSDIQTNPEGDDIVYQTNATDESKGNGLTVTIGEQRTTKNGITNVMIYNVGKGYRVGDIVSINGGSSTNPALFEVTKVVTEAPDFGGADITIQNNYLVLPDDVVGVNGVLRSVGSDLFGGGVLPGVGAFPVLMGGILGNDFACGDMGYNLVSYVAMREYLANIEFLFFPPIQYSFNQRTHRLFIDSNNFRNDSGGAGKILALDCMVKPSPDVYPDLYNDLWLKEYAVALVKAQWGRNLTKFNQVQLPGGITMNGDAILQMAREDIAQIKERFAMDWADPCLDEVG